jgi:hypothetical protein
MGAASAAPHALLPPACLGAISPPEAVYSNSLFAPEHNKRGVMIAGNSDGTARSTRLNDAPFGATFRATVGAGFLTLSSVSVLGQSRIGSSENTIRRTCCCGPQILFPPERKTDGVESIPEFADTLWF